MPTEPQHAAPNASQARWGVAMALAAAVLFAMKAVVVKLGVKIGVSSTDMLVMRMGLAAPFFAAILIRDGIPRMDRRDVISLLTLGVIGYHLSAWLDFKGMAYISAGLERLVLYAHPTLVVLFGAVWYRRRPSERELGAIAVCYLGLAIAVGGDLHRGDPRGVALGLALVFGCACTYAGYLLGTEALAPRLGAGRIAASAAMISGITLCLQAGVEGRLKLIAAYPWEAWGLGLLLAIGSTVFPVLLLAGAVARLGSGKASILGMIGPPAAAVLGFTFLGEPLGWLQVAGGAIVLIGAAITVR